MIQSAAFHLCAGVALLSGVASLVLDGALRLPSSDGVPRYVVAIGALGLLAVSMEFWRRGDAGGPLATLHRSLAAAYAIGACCAGFRPLIALAKVGEAPEIAQGLRYAQVAAIVALVFVAIPRLLWRLGQLAWHQKDRRAAAAAAGAWGAVALAVVALAVGPPSSPVAAAMLASVVYGANAACPLALLILLPRCSHEPDPAL